MYQKEKSDDLLIEILKDNEVKSCIIICVIIWMIIIDYIINLENTNLRNIITATAILATVIIISFFIIRSVKKYSCTEVEIMYNNCKMCAQDATKYEFASFDFYTLDQIIEIERKMGEDICPSECQITIYTSNLDTEVNDEGVRNVVKENLEKSVNYKIYYLRGIPTEKELKMYGKENLIEYVGNSDENKDLDMAAEFDIIVFQNSSGKINGYFSINFSTTVAPRPCAQGFICDNQCHYENDNLLYKKMRDDSTNLLLYTLREWEKKRKNYEKAEIK